MVLHVLHCHNYLVIWNQWQRETGELSTLAIILLMIAELELKQISKMKTKKKSRKSQELLE